MAAGVRCFVRPWGGSKEIEYDKIKLIEGLRELICLFSTLPFPSTLGDYIPPREKLNLLF